MLLFVGRQARPIPTAHLGLGRPRCSYAYVAGWQLVAAPVLGGCASQDTNAVDTHTGKGPRAFYGPGADPCVHKRAQRGAVPKDRADEPNSVQELAPGLLSCIRSWAPSGAPVVGLERPTTLRCRIGTDYVTRAPGARVTPHREGPGTALTTEDPVKGPITSPGLQEPW